MNRISVFSIAAALVVAAGCTKTSSEKGKTVTAGKTPEVIQGQIVAQVKDEAALAQLKEKYDVTVGDKEWGLYLLKSDSITGKEAEVAESLVASNLALSAEPNYVRRVKSIPAPRDPEWYKMWALKNYGQENVGGVTEGLAGADIRALDAWQVTTGSRDIVVAIIDTGIDYKHPDLKQNIWVNEAEKNGLPGVDDDGNGYVDDVYGWNFVSTGRTQLNGAQVGDADPMDGNGHGTHVAGTIGAVGNNGIGVTGINWNVRLMAVKFLSDEGSGSSFDEMRSIRYAMKMKADVANASYGGGPASPMIHAMLREAGEHGLLFVAAAGNDGTNNDEDPHFPSNYSGTSFVNNRVLAPLSNVISVAATNARDVTAWFSNYGYGTVDIAAPGVAILSTIPTKFNPKYPYAAYSGTSMATPHVTGAAALTLAARPELRGKPAELKRHLMETSDVLPNLAPTIVAGGRLNLYKSVKGDRSENTILAQNWVEESYSLRTPGNVRERLDYVWKVSKPGAKAIRLHIKRGHVDTSSSFPSTDLVGIYDGTHKPILFLPEQTEDLWLPPVSGDTLYVKFSNAIVSETAPDSKLYSSLADVNWARYPYCEESSGGYACSQSLGWDNGSIFPSFFTEGVEFDRISYVPADAPAAPEQAVEAKVAASNQ